MNRLLLLSCFVFSTACQAASPDPALPAQNALNLYADLCASCHGDNMEGGQAAGFRDKVWQFGDTVEAIRANIEFGIDDSDMPGFGEVLSAADMSALVALVQDPPDMETTPAVEQVPSVEDGVVIEDYVKGLDEPWGFAFIGFEDLLVTEKKGRLLYISHFPEPMEVEGIPTVNNDGQGGLLDVALDPDYADNQWVYLTYSHPLSGSSGKSMTRLIRGRIENFKWVDQEVLFEAKPEHYINTGYHYGSRITFDDDGHIFFAIGDRGKMDHAQDLTRPNGKIHRLNRDGTIPEDNPYVSTPNAYGSIYASGNRNPQGLIYHPETGVLWETEHGPRGGDELNAIKPGVNYGWPVISYGINYNGTELTPYTAKPGMAQPASQWTPSIAVCGLDVYTGDLFPEWKGRLMAGALRYETVRLIEVDGDRYVGEATLINQKGRVRDVTTGPDGAIYVALPTRIVRLSPKP